MGWASEHIEKLKNGEIVEFRPFGNSMQGRISSGQLCTVTPVLGELKVGDIVLCKVNGKQYLHIIKSIQNNKYKIGNNKGFVNGWIDINYIYGKLIGVKD